MNNGDAVQTAEQDTSVDESQETQTTAEVPDRSPFDVTLDTILRALVEQSLPDEAQEHFDRVLGKTMPRTAEGERYAISATGRFHGKTTGDLLAYAKKSKRSGALVMAEHDAERVLYFSKGQLVGSTSTVLFERLGRLLYQAGLVSHEASGTLVDAEEELGAHALLMWVSSAHLMWAIERRVWELANAVHLIKRGHFVFIDGEPELTCPTVALDPTEVALEGARRHEELRQGTADSNEVYHPAAMGELPPVIDRDLLPIDISEDTLTEILKRIEESDPLP